MKTKTQDTQSLLSNYISRPCKGCSVVFVPRSLSSKGWFCSRKCSNYNSAPRRAKKIYFNCKNCTKSFYSTPGDLRQRGKILFCSIECRNVGMIQHEKHVYSECSYCKNKIYELASRKIKKKHSFCKNICRIKYFKINPPNIRNGFWIENGYRVISIKGKPIKEHINVMQNYIGRKLKKNEVVHHINHNRKDNKIENLRLMTRSDHQSLHRKEQLER